jgi:hypothetical protein
MLKEFPTLHPLAAHLPILLILVSSLFQIVLVFKTGWLQIRWATFFIMLVGFLFALAASTLFHSELALDAPKSAWAVFAEHEKYARYTLWMAGITVGLKGIGDFFKFNRRMYDVMVLAFALTATVFIYNAAEYGAMLTHIEGAGPKGKYLVPRKGFIPAKVSEGGGK